MTEIVIVSGSVELPARLLDTPTARVIARALPLFLTAIFWGRMVELDTPLEAYREPNALQVAQPGQMLFSPEEEKILIPYGLTPLSQHNEIRLRSPSNVWAQALGDVQMLREVHDGAQVSILRAGTLRTKTISPQSKPKGRWRG